ncbi:hypothetical protein [Nonomuraea cypriaca]|nr:hypothetical protein [Nonomuraea cypriaca]
MYGSGVSWGGWTVPVAVELALVVGSGLLMLVLATARFNRPS